MSIVMDMVSAEAAGTILDFPAEIIAQLRRYEAVAGDKELIDLADATRIVAELRAAIAPYVGTSILISSAAKKYGFNPSSIYKWVNDGWVKILLPEPRRHVDEGDMVLAKEIANRQGHIAGRAVFPSKPRSGRPIKQK